MAENFSPLDRYRSGHVALREYLINITTHHPYIFKINPNFEHSSIHPRRRNQPPARARFIKTIIYTEI